MASSQAVYQPLNGKEIRQILIKRATDRINNIPMMKEGHAYHEANLAYTFTMTATPADCPVPTLEFEEAMQAQDFSIQEHYLEVTNKRESLENKKEQLLAQIDKIDSLLEIVQETTEVEEVISAGKIPDNVRIDNDLPLPRIVKETTPTGTTKMTEKSINYDQL